MKQLLFMSMALTGAMLVIAPGVSAQPAVGPGDSVMHVWETENKDGRLQILRSGDTYYGKMIYGKDLLEADGVTYKKDIHNPDTALRSRSLEGFTMISGLTYKDGKWVGGKLYYYQDGHFYDVNLEVRDSVLYMRVYKGVPMFGKTVKWSLVQ